MRTMRFSFGAAASLLFAAILIAFYPQSGAAQNKPAQDVLVVNGTTAPVPVQIDAANNTVTAQQAGTWNVGITGTPNVNIANAGPLLTRDVDRPTAQPFNLRKVLTFDAGFAFAMGGEFTVPAGKQLVIESASFFAKVPVGQEVLFARIDHGDVSHVLTTTSAGNDFDGNPVFTGTHRVFMILGPGLADLTAFRNGGSGDGSMSMTVSGYLVDTP